MALAFELGDDDLVHVEEAVLAQADVDERRLHAGQHVVDGALVDVPGNRAAAGPLQVDLADAAVLDERDARSRRRSTETRISFLTPARAARLPPDERRGAGLRRFAFASPPRVRPPRSLFSGPERAGASAAASVFAAWPVFLRPRPPRFPRRRRRFCSASAPDEGASSSAGAGGAASWGASCAAAASCGTTAARCSPFGRTRDAARSAGAGRGRGCLKIHVGVWRTSDPARPIRARCSLNVLPTG